ncbi:MAG TPA: Hsp20/alpha crystallin family protein [Candidatus Ozemobacteraceae bacterium]|nr:Hsp20/alpha crystallin family protein [Candidatus Ozemobacteraceae bacterium]
MNVWKFKHEEIKQLNEHLNEFSRAVQGRALPGVEWKTRTARVFPQVNMSQADDAYLIEAPIPGVNPGELSVQVSGNILTISGRRALSGIEQAAYHRQERRSGRFNRMFELPSVIDAARVKAEIRDGILHLILPKAAQACPKQVDVKIG